MKRILIVDDDSENISIVADMLKSGFQVLSATSGKDAIRMAVQHEPDLILLDVNMPEMDGFEVCRRIREQPATRHIPVVMLTSASSIDHRVRGLDIGADDYVTKPFQSRELMARVQARLRRFELEEKKTENLELGNLKLDSKSHQVWIDEELIKLTQLEFELLRYFLERPNQVIPRTKLLGDLWPDAVVTDRTVDTHMANLRKKIRRFQHSLATVYGAGYVLKTEASSGRSQAQVARTG